MAVTYSNTVKDNRMTQVLNAIDGGVAATDGADTAAFSGDHGQDGTLSATDGTDTAAFSGAVVHNLTGTLAAADGSDTAAFAGDLAHVGTLSAVESADTAAIAGDVAHVGTLNATDSSDTAAFAGLVDHAGTLSATDGTDTAAFSGTVSSGAATIPGDLSATDGADTCEISGSVGVDSGIQAGAGHPSISAHVLPTGRRGKKRLDDSINVAMRELYEGLTETAPQQVKKQAAKIVRPHIVAGVKPTTIPPSKIIDWPALERDAARVAALLQLWLEQVESQEDEEMLLMLMAA